MLLHDWISIEPEVSKGVLKISDDNINTGVIKDLGRGYWADNGSFVEINKDLNVGDRVLFTQHLMYEVDGQKLYRVRGRDVIEGLSDGIKI